MATSHCPDVAVPLIVMLATSCFALMYLVLFVLIWLGSATPVCCQTATMPSVNPLPFTLTSSVVESAPLSGLTDVKLSEAAVLPKEGEPGAIADGCVVSRVSHATMRTATEQTSKVDARRNIARSDISVFSFSVVAVSLKKKAKRLLSGTR